MKKLKQIEGIHAQTAFEILYGAKPALQAKTITGTLVFAGYGNDNIDGNDYVNLSKPNKFFDKNSHNEVGFYIRICEGKSDFNFPIGTMVFVKNGFDYLSNNDWSQSGRLSLILSQYGGGRLFEWYGQINNEKTILPYMAFSVEDDLNNREFYICEVAERLIKKKD